VRELRVTVTTEGEVVHIRFQDSAPHLRDGAPVRTIPLGRTAPGWGYTFRVQWCAATEAICVGGAGGRRLLRVERARGRLRSTLDKAAIQTSD